jgi:hypothetical protein
MKNISISCPKFAAGAKLKLAVVACLLALATQLPAADMVRYKSAVLGNKVKIEGKANIHDWSMEGTLIGPASFEVPAGVDLDPAKAGLSGVTGGKLDARAEVAIPVTSIKDHNNYEGMDNAMLDAMRATEFRTINFHLTEMTFKEPHAAGTPLQFDTKGELAVAGVTNKISMPVRIEKTDTGKLKVVGSVPLKMTSFNIKPPNKAGLFISEDGIVVSFEWILTPAQPSPAAK